MGRKSTGATIANIMLAFLRQRSWSQVDLARACEVSVKALRQRLLELQSAGMPLESEADPPHVYWSVARAWFPDARVLDQRQVLLVARMLERLPSSAQRTQALSAVLSLREQKSVPSEEMRRSELLDRVEDAARQRKVVRVDYYSVSRGDQGSRELSVHRVLHEDRVRVLATCHRSNTLKYFRVDEMRQVVTSENPFREVAEHALAAHLAASIGGYKAAGPVVAHSFAVRDPDARWVARNLPRASIEGQYIPGGMRFVARTTGLEQLARFVVGLGSAARVETPELAAKVHELAMGALRQQRPPRKMNGKSVGAIRASR